MRAFFRRALPGEHGKAAPPHHSTSPALAGQGTPGERHSASRCCSPQPTSRRWPFVLATATVSATVLLLEVVVLFPLLCFGGMGSLASTRLSDHTLRRVLPWSCVALGFLLVFYLAAFPALRSLLAHQNLLACTLSTMLLLAPLGLLMGLPFPVALRLLSPMAETMMPWVWGVNAVACVLGSVAAVSLAIAWGLQAVVVLGAFVYVLAGCWAHRLLVKQKQPMGRHP